MYKRKSFAFTLTEMLIVMLILLIVAAIAYPSYVSYVRQARRADGATALLSLAGNMERYFTMNNTYVGANLNNVGANTGSDQGFYRLQIRSATATSYVLVAVPQGAQASDSTCGSLTLDALGQKGITGSGNAQDCW